MILRTWVCLATCFVCKVPVAATLLQYRWRSFLIENGLGHPIPPRLFTVFLNLGLSHSENVTFWGGTGWKAAVSSLSLPRLPFATCGSVGVG